MLLLIEKFYNKFSLRVLKSTIGDKGIRKDSITDKLSFCNSNLWTIDIFGINIKVSEINGW